MGQIDLKPGGDYLSVVSGVRGLYQMKLDIIQNAYGVKFGLHKRWGGFTKFKASFGLFLKKKNKALFFGS